MQVTDTMVMQKLQFLVDLIIIFGKDQFCVGANFNYDVTHKGFRCVHSALATGINVHCFYAVHGSRRHDSSVHSCYLDYKKYGLIWHEFYKTLRNV